MCMRSLQANQKIISTKRPLSAVNAIGFPLKANVNFDFSFDEGSVIEKLVVKTLFKILFFFCQK